MACRAVKHRFLDGSMQKPLMNCESRQKLEKLFCFTIFYPMEIWMTFHSMLPFPWELAISGWRICGCGILITNKLGFWNDVACYQHYELLNGDYKGGFCNRLVLSFDISYTSYQSFFLKPLMYPVRVHLLEREFQQLLVVLLTFTLHYHRTSAKRGCLWRHVNVIHRTSRIQAPTVDDGRGCVTRSRPVSTNGH